MIFAKLAGAVPYRDATFGRTNVTIWLDNLHCDGTESNLLDCAHNGIGVHSYHCIRHNDDAGVECGRASKQTLLTLLTPIIACFAIKSHISTHIAICFNHTYGQPFNVLRYELRDLDFMISSIYTL